MFGENLNERDPARLTCPASASFWLRGVLVSVALHVVIAVLLIGIVRQGDPLVRHRSLEDSPFAAQIHLLKNVPEPTAQRPQSTAPRQLATPLPATASALAEATAPPRPSGTSGLAPATATIPNVATMPAVLNAAPAADLAALGSDYRRRLFDHIAAHRRTPPVSAPSGTVYVTFSLARDGKVQSVAIAVSSGNAVLDRVAIEAVQSADPMPMIPPAFPDRLSVTLPIAFGQGDDRKASFRP